MRAVRLHHVGAGVEVDDVPTPSPSEDEVLVRVEAAGLCGSDSHFVSGSQPLPYYPRILGHEIAGTVHVVGSDVDGVRAGDRVAINFLITCGQCRHCVSGRTSLCRQREGLGVVRDGGFADYVVAPSRNLIAIPDGVPFRHAALATDAFATPLHAISKRARVQAGEGCVIVGAGGLGLSAVQLLRIVGAYPIVAIDTNPDALDIAAKLGATHIALTHDLDGQDDLEWLVKEPLQHAFDFVGQPQTIRTATQSVGRGGQVIVVGHSSHSWETVAGSTMVREEKSVIGSYAFDNYEIEDVLQFMSRGLIDVESMIGDVVSLHGVARTLSAFDSVQRRAGRTIVVPSTSQNDECRQMTRKDHER